MRTEKSRVDRRSGARRRWAIAFWPLAGLVCLGCRDETPASVSPPSTTESTTELAQPPGPAALGRAFVELQPAPSVSGPPAAASLRWIAISGGADPYSTELQIETDALAAVGFLGAVYPGAGLVLFGGGAGTYGIHELAGDDVGGEIPLVEVIGEIFGGRGRPVAYRMNRVPAHGPADAEALLDRLESASLVPGADLTVWLSGHGEPAVGRDDAAYVVWGGDFISPQLISEATASARRDVRVLAAMCHAGGFTSIGMQLPAEGDAEQATRCVLAATTWDRVASGCDPDPERQARESYARHLVEALTGATVDGAKLALESRDCDGDGRVSWLEAHVHAAVVSAGFDVPITTSLRWAIAEGAGLEVDADAAHWSWSEVESGAARLAERLNLALDGDTSATIDAKILLLQGKIEEARAATDEAAAEESVQLARLRGALLARWAVLDDPWHPAFHATLRVNADSIAAFLRGGELYPNWQNASDRVAGLDATASELEVMIAPWLRLKLFLDARTAGKSLMRRDPEDPARRHFEALLRCERGVPGAPTPSPNP